MPPRVADQLRAKAEREWASARVAEARSFEPHIASVLAATPGLWALYVLVMQSRPVQATRGGNDISVGRALVAPDLDQVIGLLGAPLTVESFRIVEAYCGRQYGLVNAYSDGPSGMARRIAWALGLDVGPLIVLDTYLRRYKVPAGDGGAP